jgi:hypothetical protein
VFLAVLAAALALLATVLPRWIEALTGWNPDGGNGSLEVQFVVVLLTASAVFALAAIGLSIGARRVRAVEIGHSRGR